MSAPPRRTSADATLSTPTNIGRTRRTLQRHCGHGSGPRRHRLCATRSPDGGVGASRISCGNAAITRDAIPPLAFPIRHARGHPTWEYFQENLRYFESRRSPNPSFPWSVGLHALGLQTTEEHRTDDRSIVLFPGRDRAFYPLQLLMMEQQSDSQYHYQDPAQTQAFYPPPPSPGSPSPDFPSYYQTHAQPFPSRGGPPNGSSSSYPYLSQWPSPSPGSPSSSTDPELKRIRNTAASARFRAKKKRREQSLERNATEKRETLQKLEQRIEELEAENKFLKGLIFDKEKLDGVKNELQRVRALKKEIEDGGGDRDDGVGT